MPHEVTLVPELPATVLTPTKQSVLKIRAKYKVIPKVILMLWLRVLQSVIGQRGRAVERFATLGAEIGLLAGVNSAVGNQSCLLGCKYKSSKFCLEI